MLGLPQRETKLHGPLVDSYTNCNTLYDRSTTDFIGAISQITMKCSTHVMNIPSLPDIVRHPLLYYNTFKNF